MGKTIDICSLDYLVGTFATAYKGLITSLVMKDFCMSGEDDEVVLSGAILSIPQGEYTASLMHGGEEISRERLREGRFEFKAEGRRIGEAKDLRIDIVRNGRHIGTFLLKRERPDEFFSSALELSQELRGVNFKRYTSYLQDNPGLVKKAEELIAQALSTKKDWRRLSDEVAGFSRDLFWFAREAYYQWYELLVRYSLKACERVELAVGDKPVSNFLTLMEFPLEHEPDQDKLKRLAGIWLRDIRGSAIDLSYRFKQARRVLSALHEKAGAEIGPALRVLLLSLRKKAQRSAAIKDSVLRDMEGVVAHDDLEKLSRYSEKGRKAVLFHISAAEAMVEKKEPDGIFTKIDEINSALPEDTEMADLFFSIIMKDMGRTSAVGLMNALYGMLPVFRELSPEARRETMLNIAKLIGKLITLDMIDACAELLTRMAGEDALSKEDIFLDPKVALALLQAGNDVLTGKYKDILRTIVIPAPRVTGFSGETWAEVVNPRHLARLSKFLQIISLDSDVFRDVLLQVICNIHISGVFIPDDKIFQRDISAYLNSDTFRNNFLLHYMLLKKLPVYFNEVGATGRIRDYTTEIDSWGNDTVLYFLRKQTHVNASNYNIRLVEEIIRSWVYNDPEILEGVIAADAFSKLNTGLLGRYSAAIQPLFSSLGILDGEGLHLEKLLLLSETVLQERLRDAGVSDEVRSKIVLLCKIYREIVKKYSVSVRPECDGSGAGGNLAGIAGPLEQIKKLKEIIISPQKTQPAESFFFKRHIAFGIPSVLGSYHEPKFDALGEIFRYEDSIRLNLETVLSRIEKGQQEGSTEDIKEWVRCLEFIRDLFTFHDQGNFQVDELMAVFSKNTLRLSQIADMLSMWRKELTWMVGSLSRMFHGPLTEILMLFPKDELPERLRRLGSEGGDFVSKAADIVMRDLISSVTGFVELDRLLNDVINTLNSRILSMQDKAVAPGEHNENERDFFVIDELSDLDAMSLSPIMGSKAKNLAYIHNHGLRVPFGIVFGAPKTEHYTEYTESEGFASALKRAVKIIEAAAGLSYGRGKRPLFLSVRSGSYISMPGILSSILYCGMNGETLKALIENTGNPRLGWDSYRRFIEHYATIVHGLDINIFEEIAGAVMGSTTMDKEPGAGRMAEIVNRYLKELKDRGKRIPDDVYEQLKESVRAVYGSWYGKKAEQFRQAMNISGHWGTSVTLMQMIYGNARGAGASVFFTRQPFTLEKKIYGDTRENSTGDDLVYGRHTGRPLARGQVLDSHESLEEFDPGLFLQHEELAREIEDAMRGLPQEVEVTYAKGPDGKRLLYVLQTRRMELYRGFTKRFRDVCGDQLNIIGRGAGVHGGALSGVAVFVSSPEDVQKIRSEHGMPVILIREMTSTNDVSLMPGIDGIVTATGGATSHAAILAQKFDLDAVVGCSGMDIAVDEHGEYYAQIGNYTVRNGTYLSIDGSTGLVYSGLCMLTVEAET